MTKIERLTNRLNNPTRTSDLHIHFMEVMEQIEFAGNDPQTVEAYYQLFLKAGRKWFPHEHPADLFDRIWEDTKNLVAA